MPLKPPPFPAKLLEPLRQAIHAARSHPRLGPASLKRIAAEELRLLAPLPVFDLSRDDLADGKGLAAARLSGFRSLIAQGRGEGHSGALASAEIRASADGEPVTDSWHVNEGPFVAATEAALRLLDSLDEGPDDGPPGPLVVRFLRVQALHVVALWLSSPDPGRDLVVVLPPAPAGLPTLAITPVAQVESWLAEAARRQRARKDSPWP